jgi:hypothetical protein
MNRQDAKCAKFGADGNADFLLASFFQQDSTDLIDEEILKSSGLPLL